MQRSHFLKTGALAAGALWLRPATLWAQPGESGAMDEAFYKRLVKANDAQVATLMQAYAQGSIPFSRSVGSHFSACAAAYCAPASGYYRSSSLAATMQAQIALMQRSQTADGTINFSNQESPPDTSFLLELLCPGVYLLQKDGSKAALQVEQAIKPFLTKAAETIRKGGVHTPNHRWVISAALAQLHAVFPNEAYKQRVLEWLADGVYCDADGHYPERSAIYAAVEDTAFISIARMLQMPELLEPVRRNLLLNTYYLEPDGTLVTTASRRQDQYGTQSVLNYYFCYRYMAIADGNPVFAAMAQYMESLPDFDTMVLPKALFTCMENEVMLQKLPAPAPLPQDYVKVLPTVSMLRMRRGPITATLFGGADHPIIIASGRSNSPNFFSYRKGKAILQYMRLSTSFFSTGYFYSQGLHSQEGSYRLQARLEAPYYDPMQPEHRRADGNYALTPSIDNRFWNKMDFANRPVNTMKTLDISVQLQEAEGKVQLHFSIGGLKDVNITLELCFASGGVLDGVEALQGDNHFLKTGYGRYTLSTDSIRFGPGRHEHSNIKNLEGERYSTHFGSLRGEGNHVYITGKTPLEYTLYME